MTDHPVTNTVEDSRDEAAADALPYEVTDEALEVAGGSTALATFSGGGCCGSQTGDGC